MNRAATSAVASGTCRVRFGGHAAEIAADDGWALLRVALPVLAGAETEPLLTHTAEPFGRDGCTLFAGEGMLAGLTVAPAALDLETASGELYRRVFAATAGLHLYRIWNYVPHINAHAQGLENYRRFCRGRSLAFEEKFGGAFQRILPSASAVGAVAGTLAIGFLAGRAEPRHFENPQQVPAFEYPREYGPRPPSFSRATAVVTEQGRQIFISGTAAIRGHAVVAVNDLDGQLACTLENLSVIGAAAGVGADLGASLGGRRTFKVYLRHAADLRRAQDWLGRELLRPGDTVAYLQADICRSELIVEIEAVVTVPATPA